MNFNNNMAGTFRHYKFENQMIKWLYDELNHGLSLHIPSKFSKIFSFIVSYPNEAIGYEISEKYVENILKHIGQYTVYDCYIMSRGLHNALLNRKKRTPKFLDQYVSRTYKKNFNVYVYTGCPTMYSLFEYPIK